LVLIRVQTEVEGIHKIKAVTEVVKKHRLQQKLVKAFQIICGRKGNKRTILRKLYMSKGLWIPLTSIDYSRKYVVGGFRESFL
jgi:hypothetical protein